MTSFIRWVLGTFPEDFDITKEEYKKYIHIDCS